MKLAGSEVSFSSANILSPLSYKVRIGDKLRELLKNHPRSRPLDHQITGDFRNHKTDCEQRGDVGIVVGRHVEHDENISRLPRVDRFDITGDVSVYIFDEICRMRRGRRCQSALRFSRRASS